MIRLPLPRATSLLLLLSATVFVSCQTPAGILPAGTPLPLQIVGHLPMRLGEAFRAELLYPVYVDNQILLPAKTIFIGTVTELHSDHSRRIQARINGDFTPFHIPVVRFSQVVLADGTGLPISAGPATDGASILRLTAPPPRKGGFVRKQWDTGMEILHSQISVFTAPEKGDRLLQLVYHQLPYHPERIEKGTAWTIETTEPLSIPAEPALASTPANATKTPTPAPPDNGRPTWTIQAYLSDPLSSATARTGQPIQAVVAEPVYNRDHTIAVPQGALVIGAVTQAKPARSFARAGTLHFDFRQVVLPGGQTRNVQASLTGADATSAAKLAMDSEGRVKPAPEERTSSELTASASSETSSASQEAHPTLPQVSEPTARPSPSTADGSPAVKTSASFATPALSSRPRLVRVPFSNPQCLSHSGLGTSEQPRHYSHSIVPGGFEVMSYTTRLIPRTSLTILLEIVRNTSYGRGAQSAVMPSSDSTARMAHV